MTTTQPRKKHAQTFYNRHALNVLLQIFLIMREKEVDKVTTLELKENLHFSEDSLFIHLKYLSNRRNLINVSGDMESTEPVLIALTEEGSNVVNILRDIKYQSLYNANPKRKSQGEKPKKHAQTFFNRHSLNILLQTYLTMRDNEFDDLTITELSQVVHYSNESLRIHMKYLTRENISENASYGDRKSLFVIENEDWENPDDIVIKITDFGKKVVNLLRDIKYQSLYNIGVYRKPRVEEEKSA
jgi:predicted transcriptional regulator with HTH domain